MGTKKKSKRKTFDWEINYPKFYLPITDSDRKDNLLKALKSPYTSRYLNILKGLNFAYDYYNSEGFKLRLNNLLPILEEYKKTYFKNTDDDAKLEAVAYPLELSVKYVRFNPYMQNNAEYMVTGKSYKDLKFDDNTISIGNFIIDDDPLANYPMFKGTERSLPDFRNYASVTAHEFGHGFDDAIKLVLTDKYGKKTYYGYSNIYPILKRNKLYLTLYKYKKPTEHDARPSESISDLLALRLELYEDGIYNSLLPNNEAKQEHLDKYKNLRNKNNEVLNRLFRYFNDDEIIWMLNYIAQNDNVKDDFGVSYASKGRKLIRRKKLY